MVRKVLILALLAACNKSGSAQSSSDIRVDTAGKNDKIDSTGTRMCIDPDGRIFVVWSDARDGTPGIWLNRSLDGGKTWLTDAATLDGGPADSTNPWITCDTTGIYLAWEDDRDGDLQNHNIYFTGSTNYGNDWSTPVMLDNDPAGHTMSLGPRVATGGGDVFVAWFDSVDGAYDIFVASSAGGPQAFGPPVRVDSDAKGAAYSAYPRIAADSSGHVYVVWEDKRDGNSDIYFATSEDHGQSFSPDVRLDGGDDPGSNDSFEPEMAANDSGLVYVVWHDKRDGDNRSVYMNWSSDYGKSWQGTAIRADSDTPGLGDSIYPTVALEGEVAHVAWQDARSGAYDIYYRNAQAGAFGAPEARLDTDCAGCANSLFPLVTTDSDAIVVAWQDLRDDKKQLGYDDLIYNDSKDGGATWETSDLRIDSIEGGTHWAHDQNAIAFGKKLLSAWTDGRNGTADVYFHSLDIGTAASYTTGS